MAKQRWKPGAVVVIPLGEGWNAYGQMLRQPEYAFFDTRVAGTMSAEEAVRRPVLFRLWVMNRAHTQARWRIVGQAPVAPRLQADMPRFKQDPLAASQLSVVVGGSEHAASVAECEGLERAAVWEPEHVEQRLIDWYAGRPNRWVESLRMKQV